jgi:uncharacterized protein (TIGR03435 family)
MPHWSIRMNPGRRLLVILAGLLTYAASTPALADAQQSALAFEVTSVKANRTGDRSSRFQLLPGGRFVATNTTVRALLQAAYRFDYMPFQVVGGPSWLDSERFDVEGRAGTASPSPADVDAMVRTLLVTRFRMAYVRETRDMPVYHLVARAETRAASSLRPASTPCDRSPIGANTPARDPNPLPRCGARSARGTLAPTNQRIEGIGATLDELAQRLSAVARRVVINRTGLDGRFDYEVEFAPDTTPAAADVGGDTGVALFTALQEQLGLRLEPARGPVGVLVVQSAERPKDN